jgi:hypothetical protein
MRDAPTFLYILRTRLAAFTVHWRWVDSRRFASNA